MLDISRDARLGAVGQSCWGMGESDPAAKKILRALRPHMKVQKSRALATGWV